MLGHPVVKGRRDEGRKRIHCKRISETTERGGDKEENGEGSKADGSDSIRLKMDGNLRKYRIEVHDHERRVGLLVQ